MNATTESGEEPKRELPVHIDFICMSAVRVDCGLFFYKLSEKNKDDHERYADQSPGFC
jgi:hypothetical protein